MSSSTVLNVMIYATMACFPLLMVATVVVFLAKRRGSAFLQSNPRARRVYDRIVASGPKEGWSGYVIGALVLLWIAVMAALAFFSIQGGDPREQASINRSDMIWVEIDGGGYGYVSTSEIDAAAFDLIQSGQVPGEAQIAAYSDDGEVIGEYTVRVATG